MAELTRRSLLDVFLEQVDPPQPASMLSRAVLVFKIPEDMQDDELNDFLEEKNTALGEGKVTGVLLCFDQEWAIVMFEAQTRVLPDLFQALYEASDLEKFIDKDTLRIAMYSDDIGDRSFPKWAFRSLRNFHSMLETDFPDPLEEGEEDGGGDKEGGEGGEDGESLAMELAKKLCDVCSNLVELGKTLQGKDETQYSMFLETIKTTAGHLLPSRVIVEKIAKLQSLLTFKEFIDVFILPIDISLDRELVHPAPRFVRY
eukprot:TRINITY_DN82866_c0_g1_i1.p1 TRINITY_DN82866_c0_g1~~TRINITY_DN82866_c0_g1_i1.p1  ORF type:complete len:258 (-),score=88.10 TRINITY_DN82866_c0_g1_i1:111-884(-)